MTNLTAKAQEIFASDRYATEASCIHLDEVGQDAARCSLAVRDFHRNAMGAIMGGAIFTLADLAFAAAANSRCILADEPLAWVSLDSTIHYLAYAKGNKLTAQANCVKQGLHTCIYRIDILDETQRLIAQVTTTGIHIS